MNFQKQEELNMAMKEVMMELNVEKFLHQKDWLKTLLPHNELAAGLYDFMNQIQFAAEKEYHINFLSKTDKVTVLCYHCDKEMTVRWDISKKGLEVFCPYCGKKMMLCDYCPATFNERTCDYSNGSCFYSKKEASSSQEKEKINTKIFYQYYDTYAATINGSVIVSGMITEEQQKRIEIGLVFGNHYLPAILGLPCDKDYKDRVDPPYLTRLKFARTVEGSTVSITPEEILKLCEWR